MLRQIPLLRKRFLTVSLIARERFRFLVLENVDVESICSHESSVALSALERSDELGFNPLPIAGVLPGVFGQMDFGSV